MPVSAKPRKYLLTDELVATLSMSGPEERRFWDSDLPGFCLRVQRSGSASFCLKHSVDGRQRWHTLGAAGAQLDATSARAAAATILQHDRQTRPISAAKTHGITVAQMAELYLAEGPLAKLEKRASSWEADTSNLRRHVVPLIGDKLAAAVVREDIARMALAIIAGETAGVIKTCK